MNWKKFTLLSVILFAISYLPAQSISHNISLAGHASYMTGLSDVWGYADSAGNEYALVGAHDSISIVDVTNPAAPVKLHSIDGPLTIWRDLKTYSHYAYIVHDGIWMGTERGVTIIDMSGLPSTITYKDTVMDGMSTVHNIYMDDGHLYLCGGPAAENDGLAIYDLTSDPWNPVLVGEYTDQYVHDVYVRNDTAYAAEVYAGQLNILDVSDKAAAVSLGTRTYTNAFTHNTWLNDAGTVCFTTDETEYGWIYSWDVTDPSNITYLDGIRSNLKNGMTIPHNVHVLDDFLVTSYYADGVVVFDGARPHNLIQVGHYDTSDEEFDSFAGCWGAYPFLPSGHVLATDVLTGLYILNPAYQRACYLEGMVTDSVTGLPINGANITIMSTDIEDESNTIGAYATGVADAGTYTVEYSKFGYTSKIITVNLDNGVLLTENIELAPIVTFSYTLNVVEEGTGTGIPLAEVTGMYADTLFNWTADGSGIVVDPELYEGDYTFTVGKWGYKTKRVSLSALSGTPTATIELTPGYYDDFYFDFGWTEDGTAFIGDWEMGEPTLTVSPDSLALNPGEDIDDDFGSNAFVTGLFGTNANDNDLDFGTTVLTSPVMDLSGYADPHLMIHRWLAIYSGAGIYNDTLRITVDNGTTTAELIELTDIENEWVADTFRLSDFISPSATVTISVYASDYAPASTMEAGIDGFEVKDGAFVGVREEIEPTFGLNVAPNPFSNELSISLDLPKSGNLNISLLDLQGRKIQLNSSRFSAGPTTTSLNIPDNLGKGVYFLQVEFEGKTEVKKVIKM